MAGMYAERTAYNIGEAVRGWFRSLLELFFQAAGLAVDTLRTFFLIVLALLGPLAFAISVYDGFQSTLTAWIARYVGISLWLPVSDLFGGHALASADPDALAGHRTAARPRLHP